MLILNVTYEPKPDGTPFEQARPFVLQVTGLQKLRLTDGEAHHLWCQADRALDEHADAQWQAELAARAAVKVEVEGDNARVST